MRINKNFSNLKDDYFFYRVISKTKEFKAKNPDKKVISLGIGDTTLPLCEAVISAMQKSVLEMSKKETYRGYALEQGYEFLRLSIKKYYQKRGLDFEISEIFIDDGAGRAIAEIQELFSTNNKALIVNPAYPAYVDTNVIAGREIIFIEANEENLFLPTPSKETKGDIIYLCSPNNPTGSVYTKEGLKKWVDYALQNNAIILFDAAYEAFVSSKDLPRSIFEIEGARKCAVEVCSLSKTAGFTGVRCGYTIIPDELVFDNCKISKLWMRRQTTKYNGLSYITQRGAEAVFTDEGQKQNKKMVDYYKENVKIIHEGLDKIKIWNCGHGNSPYIFAKCPNGMSSWKFFDLLLNKISVVVSPGVGFGYAGEGFVRLSGFGDKDETAQAVKRFGKIEEFIS
ncbi:MAG: LL-diaminopimelate aminotransferase [Oscillospiraceae bacterium]|nr:LL-diaminopimelate aminotransferase [Oscillospiraceae bacterium]